MQEKPYEQGYDDFFQGVLTSCYRPRSFYAKEWLRGFNAAYFINRNTHVQSIPEEYLQQV
jgi:hypothetical protein